MKLKIKIIQSFDLVAAVSVYICLQVLRIDPSENALALTLKDMQSKDFVKYINHLFKGSFHVISFTFHE